MRNASTYFLLLERIDVALNAISGFICSRPCCFEFKKPCRLHKHGHHTFIGLSKHICDGKKFSEKEIETFDKDIKHGVLHGVLTFVAGSIIEPEIAQRIENDIDRFNINTIKNKHKLSKSPLEMIKSIPECREEEKKVGQEIYANPSKEQKILVSCLVHDILKCCFGAENHDKNLIEYFPNIDEPALTHSNPIKKHESENLIRYDRLELYRFENSENWVNRHKVYKNLTELEIDLLDMFYQIVRPVLEKSYAHKDERWIRHGLERAPHAYRFDENYPSMFFDFSQKPHEQFFINKDNIDTIWAVELSKGSLGDCIVGQTKPQELFESIWQENSGFFSWELVQGKIPLKEYRKKIPKDLIISQTRDHFFAYGQIPTKDWIFTHKNASHKVLANLIQYEDVKFCHEKTVKKTIKVCEKIIDVFYAIKQEM
tara:strand:- start:2370 stop:3653 length:1284 start_codon:yes stop_codon:yes gene_type:complete